LRFKTVALFLSIASSILFAKKARAFDDATQFFNVPGAPHAATFGASGEGIYFTGAPRFLGMTCDKCHTDGPGLVRLKLGADDVSLFSTGYNPGQTYQLEVEIQGETKGLDYSGSTCTEPPLKNDHYTYQQCNNNSFAMEIDTLTGPLAGATVFCANPPVNGNCPAPNPLADESMVSPDNDAVFGNRQHQATNPKTVARNDPTTWHLWWTAPAAGTGPVTIFVGAVDGNGGDGTAASDQDPYNDDTVQASFFIQEAGASVPNGATASCAVARRQGGAGAAALVASLFAAACALARRRARRALR
jgi:hypothetical protein